MSGEKKRLKEQMLVNSAINSIKRQLTDLENSRKAYIKAAVTAREEGIASQYNLAKNAIRIVTAQKAVVEQMLLNLQISAQIKDVSDMTKSFADGMKLLSGSLTDTNESLKFEKVTKQMNKAMLSTQMKQAESDMFMENTGVRFSGISSGGIEDDEIDKMIAVQSGAPGSVSPLGGSSEANIDDEISALERKLKSGGKV